MYPGTIVKWHDMSGTAVSTPETVDNSPLFLAVSSFDRGPEDLRVVSGDTFYDLYGTKMNFNKHGQPAIQAANIIDAGGRLLLKRLVANDATLANVIGIATTQGKINAVKADPSDPTGKTLEEIITGKPGEAVEYAEELTLESAIGSTDNSTAITVAESLTPNFGYLYKETDTDVLPEKGTIVNTGLYTEWDGSADIHVADGTKIQIIEYNKVDGIIRSGVIVVVSKIPHPVSTSESIDGLNAFHITSAESTSVEGNTALTVSPAIGVGNKYFYAKADEVTVIPQQGVEIASADFKAWKEWNGSDEITLADGTEIILGEFTEDTSDPIDTKHTPVKGAKIAVVSKLPADVRTSNSIKQVVPTEDKYNVVSQNNSVKWTAVSVSNCKTYDDVVAAAKKLYKKNDPAVETTDEGVVITVSTSYPLIVATDNGRGVSSKAVKFSPDYSTSKDMSNMFYTGYVFDGTSLLDNYACTLNPSTVFSNTLYGLHQHTSIQVQFAADEDIYNAYLEDIEDLTGYTVANLKKYDLIYMTDSKGAALSLISLDPESVDFGAEYGVELQNGSNGEFGDVPFGSEAYINAALDLLNGNYDDGIFDVDTYKISAIFDANYPDKIKDAFAKFATFREDCVFFRDYGLDVKSYASIVAKHNSIDEAYRNKFNAEYFTTYEIYDPETKVRERVTMFYDFARLMVNHFAKGPHKPLAGVANNMILSSAIEGTINFVPHITYTVNQKSLLDDLKINYAIFEEGRCVVQSLYTAQEENTQLSYINNVLAIQEVIRSVRINCPKNRFTFTSGSDFSAYAEAVNNVIKGFRSNFSELRFEYEQNNLQAANKIFYASIYFRFGNWAQTEHFDVYALGNE